MLENLPHNPSVTSPDDQHPGRPWMNKQRDMADHFMVRELVELREHGDPVDHQHSSQSLGFYHPYVLELGARAAQEALDLHV